MVVEDEKQEETRNVESLPGARTGAEIRSKGEADGSKRPAQQRAEATGLAGPAAARRRVSGCPAQK